MIAAQEFIDLLEERDLVSPELIASLRKQLAASVIPITAPMIARGLVEKGHLSRLLAQRLLNRAEELGDSGPASIREKLGLPSKTLAEEKAEEEQLTLAPLEEDEEDGGGASPHEQPADFIATELEDWGLTPLEDPVAREIGAPLTAAPAPEARPEKAPSGPAAKPQVAPPAAAAPSPASAPANPPLKPIAPPSVPRPVAPARPAPTTTVSPTAPSPAPLDDLFGDLGIGPATPGKPRADQGALSGFPGEPRAAKKRRRENVWDSPLLLVGGGALLVLILAAAALLWSLRGRGADELLAQADKDYRAGNYQQAVGKYDEYLNQFGGNAAAGAARVRRGLARMRQAAEGTSDWPGALATVQEEIRQVGAEETFKNEAGPELAAVLPAVAQGLAEQARAGLDPRLVQQARETISLVDRHVPESVRPAARLNEIEDLLTLAERDILRGRKLEEALTAMRQAAGQGNAAAVYEIRRALVKQYPALASDAKLDEAVRAASAAEASSVKVVNEKRAAEAAQAAERAPAGLVLARRSLTAEAPQAAGRVAVALADGAAYGLDAATGKILWRRVVGFDINGRTPGFPPTPVSPDAGADVLMVDRQGRQVLRIEAATGRVRWRHVIGEPFDAHPVVSGKRLLVATRSGRLVTVDLASGDSSGYVQLPQELRVAPAIDPERGSIYQVAEHSNLYVLGSEDGRPKQVAYLGHEPATVVLPPLVIGPYLVILVDDGLERTTLKVLALDADEKGPALRTLGEVSLDGRVNTAPAVSGARFLVVTDHGDINIFELTAAEGREPLARIASGKTEAKRRSDQEQQVVRFPFMTGGQVWIADDRLTRYDVLASRGRLEPRAVEHEASVTLQPLAAAGQAMIHVRRRSGLPGVLVSAIAADDAKPLWETHLASPLVAEPLVDAAKKQVTAVTAGGAVFRLEEAAIREGATIDHPLAAIPTERIRGAVTEVVALEDGRLAMATSPGTNGVFVLDPPRKPEPIFRLPLADPPACAPAALAGGLLVPCTSGQVHLLDPRSGARQVEPFQPTLTGRGPIQWREPTVLEGKELLLSDGVNRLFRVGIVDQPKPHLAELASRKTASPLMSPIAVLGATAFAVDAAGNLNSFRLPDLSPGESRPLSARCLWGPRRLGDRVVLVTDDETLHVIGGDGKSRADRLPYGPLAGSPADSGGELVLASARGVVWRIDPATGKELGKKETGLLLKTGPVPLGDRLLVSSGDGLLYLIERP